MSKSFHITKVHLLLFILSFSRTTMLALHLKPRGVTSISGGREGPHIKFGDKIWGKVQPNSPDKRKNLGSSVTIRHKSWAKIPILGSYLNSEGKIWGICHIYFWRQNLGLQQEFQRQILGPRPSPGTPTMKVLPLGPETC